VRQLEIKVLDIVDTRCNHEAYTWRLLKFLRESIAQSLKKLLMREQNTFKINCMKNRIKALYSINFSENLWFFKENGSERTGQNFCVIFTC